MMNKILSTSAFLFMAMNCLSQEVILPLQINPLQRDPGEEQGLKSAKSDTIHVDLTSSKIILLDDFSSKTGTVRGDRWADRNVYINRSFAKNPVSLGTVTFDGLDRNGYPYNFITPTSYGPCDTLTCLPIQLSRVNPANGDDTVYLSFYYQPQGIYPFANSTKDSIFLEFRNVQIDTVLDSIPNQDSTIWFVDTVIQDNSVWSHVWGKQGSAVYDFRHAIVMVAPTYYKDGFQFRFITFGNTSGNLDQWHLDNVYLSSEKRSKHEAPKDVAFCRESGSLVKTYEAMPWFHYYDNPSLFIDTSRMPIRMSNTYTQSVNVDLEYHVYDPTGLQVDSLVGASAGGTNLPPSAFNTVAYKDESIPLKGKPYYPFKFPTSSSPKKSTVYFLRRNIMKNLTVSDDLFSENNTVTEYQVFGTYYAYDDGTAEAGYGIKAAGGKLAYKFTLPAGISDYISSFYMYFNPVVEDRSNEIFRLTIWNDDNGKPGNILYQNSQVSYPTYPKMGVNAYERIFLGDSVLVSGSFYIGWQKVSAEVLNIGYDLNRDASDKIFFDIGSGWQNSKISGSVPPGAIMLRPSFGRLTDPVVGAPRTVPAARFEVELFPNPASHTLNLFTETNGQMFAGIYQMDGKAVRSFQFEGEISIDVGDLQPGFYIVRILNSSAGQMLNRKLIVAR